MRSLWRRVSRQTNGDDDTTIRELTLPAVLEDGRVPVLFDRFSYISSALILALLIWGSIAEIREFASTQGQVVPSSFVKLVHHLEGGQVDKVLADEGQIVEEGQTLMELRPVAAESDLGQLSARRQHLFLKRKRLDALIAGEPLDLGDVDEAYEGLKRTEEGLYENERALLAKELRTINARIAQRKVEIESLGLELQSLERQVEIQEEQLGIRSRLLESGYTSRRAFLDAQSALEKAKAEVIATKGRLGSVKEQLAEAESEYQQAESKARAKYSEERSKIAGEIAELVQSIQKLQDRVDRLQIQAPVRGVIQELSHRAPGEVVKPGDLVAKIVPLGEEVVAEVNVEPKDIGHVKVGDKAELTISTFDPNVYGVLNGTVARLSATTFQKEDGSAPYFKAIIKLEKGYFGSAERPISILPGMEVKADIITGAKSLVKYFLKPVYRSLDTAFSER